MDGIHRPSDDEFGGAERAAGTRRVEEGVAISVHGAGHHAALQGVLLRWGRRAETRGGEGVREPRTGGRGGGGGGGGREGGHGAPVRGRHPVARRRTPRRPASGGWGEGGSARSRRNVGRRETRGPSLRASSARGRRTATSSPPKAWSLCSAPFLRRSRSRRSLRSARRDADREEEDALPPSMVEWEASQRRRALLTGAVRLVLAVVRFRLSWARQDRLRRMASSQKDGSANSNARATDLKCRRLCRTPREHSRGRAARPRTTRAASRSDLEPRCPLRSRRP